MIVLIAIVAWLGVSALIVLMLHRSARCRAFDIEAVVRAEMANVDEEYRQLCRGGRR